MGCPTRNGTCFTDGFSDSRRARALHRWPRQDSTQCQHRHLTLSCTSSPAPLPAPLQHPGLQFYRAAPIRIASDFPQSLDDAQFEAGVRLRVWQPGGEVTSMPSFGSLLPATLRLDTVVPNVDCKTNDAHCFRAPGNSADKFGSNIGALVRSGACSRQCCSMWQPAWKLLSASRMGRTAVFALRCCRQLCCSAARQLPAAVPAAEEALAVLVCLHFTG